MEDYKDYYAILRVSPNASQQEIRRAYRREIQFFHPDRWPPNHTMRQEAEKRTRELNEAYEVLSDPAKRREYDILREFENLFQVPIYNAPEEWVASQEPLWQAYSSGPPEPYETPPISETSWFDTDSPVSVSNNQSSTLTIIAMIVVIILACYVLTQIDWLKLFGDILRVLLNALNDWIIYG